MNFASISFLFYFLPLALAVYYLGRSRSWRNIALLTASLIFYSWGEGVYLVVLIASIIGNQFFALRIANSHADKMRRWLALGITANLALLITFKYAGFISAQLSWLGAPPINVHLPLGISFFTFQAMSMLIDVYRGHARPQTLYKTALYIAMFPQLVAGPIVRFNAIRDQIDDRRENISQFADGIRIFILGLAQKVLIADVLATPVDMAFSASPADLTLLGAWLGIICFSFQIFYDFAGYSNIAIGLGRMMGFELPQNFNYPYSARSIRGFWRRWHITLSNWFRDYLYIPLGGSRLGPARTYSNLLIVFVLCGLWHGAAWTFLAWGLWHGVFLIIERLLPKAVLSRLCGPVIGPLYVFLAVSLGWVLFRAPDMAHAVNYWQAMFVPGAAKSGAFTLYPQEWMVLTLAAFLAWQGWEVLLRRGQAYLAGGVKGQLISALTGWGLLLAIFALSLISVAGQTHQPFLYFRF